jgi:hypothetical protein
VQSLAGKNCSVGERRTANGGYGIGYWGKYEFDKERESWQ